MPIQIPNCIQIKLLDEHLNQIRKHFFDRDIDCFISYSWGESANKKKVKRLADSLRKAGITVFLDLTNNHQLNSSINKFIEKILSVKYVILAGSATLMEKYTKKIECNLNKEIQKIEYKFRGNNSVVVGISLNGNFKNCLPKFLQDKVIGSYTNDFDVYAKVTLDLLEYFAPAIIKQDIKTIIEKFNNTIEAIQFNISHKRLLEHQSMNSLQLAEQITINVDDLLKKDYLKTLNSDLSFKPEKTNLLESLVYITSQNADHIMITKGGTEKYKYNDLVDTLCCAKQNIMIQGDSGIGKSTLCKFMVHSWASNKKLLDFKFVFFIKASNLNESRYPAQHTKYKEIDIIIKECFVHTLTEISSIILEMNINYKKYKILWIIDEYDGSLTNIPTHLQDVFNNIISNPYTVLTSKSHPEKFPYYQITGFSENTQQHYIDLFFDSLGGSKNKRTKKSLLHLLRENHLVSTLCLIPMYLEFICNVWLKQSSDLFENVNLGITKLYQEIFIFIINRFLIEKELLQPNRLSTKYELRSRLYLPLLVLKEISFFICKQNRDIFTYEELEKHCSKLFHPSEQNELFSCSLDVVLRLGIVSRNGNNFKFIDPSLKMFFVAKHLTDVLEKSTYLCDRQNFKDNFAWFIRNYKYIKNNDLLLSFVSGLLTLLSKNNDFSGSLFLKETTMLFWKNIFSSNLDFVGVNHIYLLLKCLKETDCNITFSENPQIKSYIYRYLPNILKYIRINNIAGCINMFLSVFNDPSIIETIISLDLLKDIINFIAHTEKRCSNSILSNLLANGKSDYRKKILDLVDETLLKISNIESDVVGIYFAISKIEDESNNEKFLSGLLQSSDLKNKRAALKIILVQAAYGTDYSTKITNLLRRLAADINPVRTECITKQILQIDSSDDKQLLENKGIINELIEMDKLSFLCIDILYYIYGYTADFLDILDKIYNKATSPSIMDKTISITFTMSSEIEEEVSDTDATDDLASTDIDDVTNDYISKEEYIKYIASNHQSINWQTISLDIETLVKLEEKNLTFLVDNNIFILNTPLINLIQAYATTYPNNALLGILIINRILYNCHKEVLTINNNGIMIYDENIVFLEANESKEISYVIFIDQFAKLFYNFARKNSFPLEHKTITFIYEKEMFYYGSQYPEFKDRTTYFCASAELLEPNLTTTKQNSIHSEQGISDEDQSSSSISTFNCDFISHYRKNSSLQKLEFGKQSDSTPQTPISTKYQFNTVPTIARQVLSLRC